MQRHLPPPIPFRILPYTPFQNRQPPQNKLLSQNTRQLNIPTSPFTPIPLSPFTPPIAPLPSHAGNDYRGSRKNAPPKPGPRASLYGDNYRVMLRDASRFFFTNFPESYSHANVWSFFGRFGSVLNVFISKRRNRKGNRFGFVSIAGVQNADDLAHKMNGTKIGGYSLIVNIPNFKRRVPPHAIQLPQPPSHHYQQVPQPPPHHLQHLPRQPSNLPHTVPLGKTTTYSQCLAENISSKNPHTHASNTGHASSSSQSNNWNGPTFSPSQDEAKWLEDCFVGIIHDHVNAFSLQEHFHREGLLVNAVPMGGNLVLLKPSQKGEIQALIGDTHDIFCPWFSDIRPWSTNFVGNSRYTWIKCYGVPLHAWCERFFKEISTKIGTYCMSDESTTLKRRLDFGRALIKTSGDFCINRIERIQINDDIFPIRLVEDCCANGEYSLPSEKTGIISPKTGQSEDDEYSADRSDHSLESDLGDRSLSGDEYGKFELMLAAEERTHDEPIISSPTSPAKSTTQIPTNPPPSKYPSSSLICSHPLDPPTTIDLQIVPFVVPLPPTHSPPKPSKPSKSCKPRPKKDLASFFADLESDIEVTDLVTDTEVINKNKKNKGQNRRRGKQKKMGRKQHGPVEDVPSQSLSLSDGQIVVCNHNACKKNFEWEALEMKKIGERIGVVGKGNDKQIFLKLLEMEERDQANKA